MNSMRYSIFIAHIAQRMIHNCNAGGPVLIGRIGFDCICFVPTGYIGLAGWIGLFG